jgi:DGQHR domain-containing protein
LSEERKTAEPTRRRLPALKVRQWIDGWANVDFDPSEHRKRPEPHFYIFSLPAQELRRLTGIARREAKDAAPRTADLGIQRAHDPERSDEIARFVEFGYPWSTLSKARRKSEEFNDLRKPGWLPTAIVINILTAVDRRQGVGVSERDLVEIDDASSGVSHVSLPYQKWSNSWWPDSLPPFEVIDGQHRLWSFGSSSLLSEFEVPVVAFHGLDISWQAYLFWTINIKPKRINPSLAFDLYPLLRAEDWLERGEGHSVYRETRAQELTEILWSHESSPWYDRINMLGEKKNPWVTQSAWVKSLLATLVRPWEGRGRRLGGLFGSRLTEESDVLGWSRAQQAAFLIFFWQQFSEAVEKTKAAWATAIRNESQARAARAPPGNPAFFGQYSLIMTDQGVRGILHVLNDMCFMMAARLHMNEWTAKDRNAKNDTTAVSNEIDAIRTLPMSKYLGELAVKLSTFDWRTSAFPNLAPDQRMIKLVFRGSSGYKEIRAQLIDHLAAGGADDVSAAAQRLKNTA